MTNYEIDNDSWFHEGGYSQLYPLIGYENLAFKEYSSKKRAEYAKNIQKKLSKFDLAPEVLSDIIKLPYAKSLEGWTPDNSDWGYVTELAQHGTVSYKQIQDLVNEIFKKTKLKFWDCHFSNIGYIKRNGKKKIVCIDTGRESFDGYSNAWGFADPGPKCSYCLRYQCRCSQY